MKTIIRWVAVSIVSLALFGCGGGGSDSGGGSGGVTFTGPLTVFANGAREDGQVTITIRDGSVSVSDGSIVGTAPLSADGSQFAVPLTINDPGIRCNQPVIYSGEVEGNNIEGTISGSATCSVGSFPSAVVNVTGSFSATTNTVAKVRAGAMVLNAIRANFG